MRMTACGVLILMAACNASSGDTDTDAATGTVTTPTSSPTTMTTTTPTTSGATDIQGPTSDPETSTTTTTGPVEPTTSTTLTTEDPLLPDLPATPDLPPEPLVNPQLWYSVEDKLVYIEISALDGSVVQLVTSTINNNPTLGGDVNSCGLTMLDDGSLLGSRGNATGTRMFHIPNPPTVAGTLDVEILGMLPDAIFVEALHTGCDGRIYLMDTGSHSSNNDGNRLLQFDGDYLNGGFTFKVITDLEVAASADVDDMAPGLDADGDVIDNPGFGIDSGMVYALDYTTGNGNLLGNAGTYGIHVLGRQLFDDDLSRLYVLDIDANLFQADPVSLAVSPILVTGPSLESGGSPGNTGLAGPLTDCVTGFRPG